MTAKIGTQVTGKFSFLALYPFDTQVILRIPSRAGSKKDGPSNRSPEALQDLLNSEQLEIGPFPPHSRRARLEFRVEPLSEIFVDSPNATWAALRADLPGEWFRQAFAGPGLPSEVQALGVHGSILLLDGGMAILAVEATYTVREPETCVDRFPQIVKATAECTGRYKNQAAIDLSRAVLVHFATALRTAVAGTVPRDPATVRLTYRSLVDRIRKRSVLEGYPTIVTRIDCKAGFRPAQYQVAASDLTEAMYLDVSEISNALPTFEDDFIAVGYDSVWWLVAGTTEERSDHFRDRVRLTFQYALGVSMLVYILHAEIDQELRELRDLRSSNEDHGRMQEELSNVRLLRAEVEDLFKELSLESFSTWISDIFLFRRILENWLVYRSIDALRDKIDAVNVILREVYQERSESEQRELTRLGTIFAAASLASLFVAAATLFFTETHWEVKSDVMAGILLLVKLILVVYIVIGLPMLLWLIPRWDPRLRHAIARITIRRS